MFDTFIASVCNALAHYTRPHEHRDRIVTYRGCGQVSDGSLFTALGCKHCWKHKVNQLFPRLNRSEDFPRLESSSWLGQFHEISRDEKNPKRYACQLWYLHNLVLAAAVVTTGYFSTLIVITFGRICNTSQYPRSLCVLNIDDSHVD